MLDVCYSFLIEKFVGDSDVLANSSSATPGPDSYSIIPILPSAYVGGPSWLHPMLPPRATAPDGCAVYTASEANSAGSQDLFDYSKH